MTGAAPGSAEQLHQEDNGGPLPDTSRDSNLARQLRYQRGRMPVRHLAKYDVHNDGKLYDHKTLSQFVHLERFAQMRLKRVDPAFDILDGNLSEVDCLPYGIDAHMYEQFQADTYADLIETFNSDFRARIDFALRDIETDRHQATTLWAHLKKKKVQCHTVEIAKLEKDFMSYTWDPSKTADANIGSFHKLYNEMKTADFRKRMTDDQLRDRLIDSLPADSLWLTEKVSLKRVVKSAPHLTLESIEEQITDADDTIRAVSKPGGRIARDRAHAANGKGDRPSKTDLRKTLQASGLKREEVNHALSAIFPSDKDKTKSTNDRKPKRGGGGGGDSKGKWNSLSEVPGTPGNFDEETGEHTAAIVDGDHDQKPCLNPRCRFYGRDKGHSFSQCRSVGGLSFDKEDYLKRKERWNKKGTANTVRETSSSKDHEGELLTAFETPGAPILLSELALTVRAVSLELGVDSTLADQLESMQAEHHQDYEAPMESANAILDTQPTVGPQGPVGPQPDDPETAAATSAALAAWVAQEHPNMAFRAPPSPPYAPDMPGGEEFPCITPVLSARPDGPFPYEITDYLFDLDGYCTDDNVALTLTEQALTFDVGDIHSAAIASASLTVDKNGEFTFTLDTGASRFFTPVLGDFYGDVEPNIRQVGVANQGRLFSFCDGMVRFRCLTQDGSYANVIFPDASWAPSCSQRLMPFQQYVKRGTMTAHFEKDGFYLETKGGVRIPITMDTVLPEVKCQDMSNDNEHCPTSIMKAACSKLQQLREQGSVTMAAVDLACNTVSNSECSTLTKPNIAGYDQLLAKQEKVNELALVLDVHTYNKLDRIHKSGPHPLGRALFNYARSLGHSDIDISHCLDYQCPLCMVFKAKAGSRVPIAEKNFTKLGECIALDEIGPFNVESVGGNKMALMAIDLATHFDWVFGHTGNSAEENLESIKEIAADVTGAGRKIGRLHSDAGSSLTSHLVSTFCIDQGWRRTYAAGGQQWRNADIERHIQEAKKLMRILRAQGEFEPKHWLTLLRAASFLLKVKRGTTLTGQRKTEFELLFPPVDTSALIPIGTACVFHRAAKGTWKEPGNPGVLIGYTNNISTGKGTHLGYEILTSKTGVIVEVAPNQVKFVLPMLKEIPDTIGVEDIPDDVHAEEAETEIGAILENDTEKPEATTDATTKKVKFNTGSLDRMRLFDSNATFKCQFANPKQLGSKSYDRYEAYKSATNKQTFLAQGGRRADFENDSAPQRGFIKFIDTTVTAEGGDDTEIANVIESEILTQATELIDFNSDATILDMDQANAAKGNHGYTKWLNRQFKQPIRSPANEIADIPDSGGLQIDPATVLHKLFKKPPADKIPESKAAVVAEFITQFKNGTYIRHKNGPPAEETKKPGFKLHHVMMTLKEKWVAGVYEKMKARGCLRGDEMDIDPNESYFKDTYSPVISLTALFILFTLMTQFDWLSVVLDITGAFTTAPEKETIFVHVPWGILGTGPLECWQLQMGLYGSKHAAIQFYLMLMSWLLDYKCKIGQDIYSFKRLIKDLCVFSITTPLGMLIIAIYVDDIVVFASKEMEAQLNLFVSAFLAKFPATSGPLSTFTGLHINHDRDAGTTTIHQNPYTHNIITRFNLQDTNRVATPIEPGLDINPNDAPGADQTDIKHEMSKLPFRQIIGAVNYATHTRWDLALSLHIVSRYMSNPFRKLWVALSYMCRYINAYPNFDRILKKTNDQFKFTLTCFVDASYAPSWSPKGKSITCFFIWLGACLIMVEVKTQSVVAQSSTEAEIIALAAAIKKLHYLVDFLAELGFVANVVIYEDNNGTIANASGRQMNETVKHIRTKYWFIRESIDQGIELRKVHTYWQLADIHTKIHNSPTWIRLRDSILAFDPATDYSKLTPEDKP